ncbi:NADP-dependent oxidoreductase [Flavobacteriaceae bacterium]|jgi:NADPH-dependent curcumin reductase CurA|nr:NADP-dependent oxidoreductase [Flavobacteriaceae bacterium]MDC0623391.1 NADP-dependent oxidoreductase [Flavobacteriaceae bacterium]
MINKKMILVNRPTGIPEKNTWSFEEELISEIKDGQILIKQQYISLDPAMRGWMNNSKSYIPPVEIGTVMRAGTVGEVIQVNNNTNFKVGDFVSGWGGVQEYSITDGKNYSIIKDKNNPIHRYLGALGMPGMTAYFGIINEGKIKSGDIVLVSAAAGAVGSLVGQIAKIKGCKVIGIAGGNEKCKYVKEQLGFDEVIDYKNDNIYSSLKKYCREGIDVYFDNVGGEILDAALAKLRMNARIVICGAISQYNNTSRTKGPSNYLSLLVNRATMKGMVVFDYKNDYPMAINQISEWFNQGKLKSNESIFEGIDNFYETFLKLFNGNKRGKLILKL